MRKPIESFETLYEIDDLGNVYSLPKKRPTPTTIYYTKERMLKPYVSEKGYLLVDLRGHEKRTIKTVHRLVAEAFIPNPENKPQVNHIDGNKQNNCVDNLEWCTNSENQIHAFKSGLQKGNFKHHNSKLSYEDVVYIKNHYVKNKRGCGMRILAKKFNVSCKSIKQIITGKSYKNVK